ncbi:MAG: universal stress protein [Terriglobales bacterium]
MASLQATPVHVPAPTSERPAVSVSTLLVATDFSPASDGALRCAAALAQRLQAKIFLLHVLPFQPGYPKPMQLMSTELDGDENDANAKLYQALSAPELKGIPHEALLCRSELWPALEANIRHLHAGMVVVGTHGREGFRKLLLGSVAEQVFRQSTCPVLTVGPHLDLDCLQDGGFRRVLYATDLSESSRHALPYALALAKQNLTLLHVLCSDITAAEYGATVFDRQDFASARDSLRTMIPPSMDADVIVESGLPASTILRIAQEQNANLIVMGVNPSSAFAATHLPWATAHRVICDAHCPVLTVR